MKNFIEKLINRLEEELKLADEVKEKCARENPLMFYNAKGYATGMSNAKYIVNQLAEEYNNGWIPCSERLPEEWEYYLVSDGQSVYIAEYADYEWRYHCTDSNEIYVCEDILAWQPLPAPFERKGE